MNGAHSTGSADYYAPPPPIRPGQAFYEGTAYGHTAYVGPNKLTDARPWADEAACRDLPDIFDQADASNRIESKAEMAAKAVCAGCPCVTDCLAEAMAEETGPGPSRFSVRGGLSARERGELWQSAEDRVTARARFIGVDLNRR